MTLIATRTVFLNIINLTSSGMTTIVREMSLIIISMHCVNLENNNNKFYISLECELNNHVVQVLSIPELQGLYPLDQDLPHHVGLLTQHTVCHVMSLTVPGHHIRQLCIINKLDLGPGVGTDVVPLHEAGVVVTQSVGCQPHQIW